jgi:ABC-type branched-subunit amino acid transport system ATPase component
LGKIDLIVGKNAVGKTRMMNVLKNVARQVNGKMTRLLNGKTDLAFVKPNGDHYTYQLHIVNGSVSEERLAINGKIVLDRNQSKAEIWDSEGNRKLYEPPADKLTLQVRRTKESIRMLKLFQSLELFYQLLNLVSLAALVVLLVGLVDIGKRLAGNLGNVEEDSFHSHR